ncbi:MAG: alcohol dehydrogenase catalytic domain-containing protein [Myxococcota bacterium]
MRQARWTETGIELIEADPPPLRDGWVRLRVSACGICGSDLHLYRRELPPVPGWVPGHEVAGTLLDGPPDELYAVEPRSWCGDCDLCHSGRRHLCPQGAVFGLTVPMGGLGDTIDVPPASIHPVDPGIPPVVASMAEPLAVCVRAVHLARLESASRVLILGGGTIGLLCGLLAREFAAEVAITVRHPHQREVATKLGLLALAEKEADAWAADRGPDVVIETVGGRAETLGDAVRLCRVAGRVVVLGVFAGDRPVNALLLMMKELTVVGSNTYGTDRRGSEFRTACEMLRRHREEIAMLQTHRFSLEELLDAFRCAADKRTGAIKVTIVPG